MTWEIFYLVCFVVGFAFSALSFLTGVLHLPHFFAHWPHGTAHGLPHVHLPQPGHGGAGNAPSHAAFGSQISALNLPTIMVFLAWFGATGYLLTHYSRIWGVLGLLFSVLVGVVGAAIVFSFMAKVLVRSDENLDPAEYVMLGTLGRLTVGIREGGTGEIVYAQGGTRKSAAARSEDGRPIDRGVEVVVTRYDKGIAYVRRWDELAGETSEDQAQGAEQH